MTAREPALELKEDESTFGTRVQGAAFTGGMVAASPCSLCQLGGCTPEMLVACSGIFAVGAVVGGVVGVGQELGAYLSSRSPAAPGVPLDELRAVLEPARGKELAQAVLMACLGRELEDQHAVGPGTGPGPQGHSWVSVAGASEGESRKLDEGLAALGYQYRVEVDPSRVALLPQGARGRFLPEAQARLILEGDLKIRRLSQSGGPALQESKVTWEGAPHPVREWLPAGSELATREMQEGCQGLARTVVSTTLNVIRGK